MLRYTVLNKSVGQTPLQAIEEWRQQHPAYAAVPASYAGRLDPMASGKLIVLLGDECKRLKEYTGLDKEYEIEVVLVIGTDTGDALGMPTAQAAPTLSLQQLQRAYIAVTGTHEVPYPSFSSKTVNGIPLFQYALEGRLSEIEIPTHAETIYSIRTDTIEHVSGADLLSRIQPHLRLAPRTDDPAKRLGADFRQDDIRAAWVNELEKHAGSSFSLVRLRATCASGTYMRTLAERLGKELGTTGFALSITRTRIGTYKKLGPVGLWTKRY
jgi:tRNA U55 pseudouridine synthase TruB